MGIVLSIAGTDPSGGAGIQVDLQVFRDLGHHGCSVVTAVLWQDTAGVKGWRVLSASDLRAQLEVITQDVRMDAVKIGVVPAARQVEVVAEVVSGLGVPVVWDPVLASGDGKRSLVEAGAIQAMRAHLMACVSVVTPNIPEFEQLTQARISDFKTLAEAAAYARQLLGVEHVLLKAGHATPAPDGMMRDALAGAQGASLCRALARHDIADVRGTGCQLSSAIAAGLADGMPMREAVERARAYLGDLLGRRARYIGKGRAVITREEREG